MFGTNLCNYVTSLQCYVYSALFVCNVELLSAKFEVQARVQNLLIHKLLDLIPCDWKTLAALSDPDEQAHNMPPPPVTLTFDLLTLKVMSESRVT